MLNLYGNSVSYLLFIIPHLQYLFNITCQPLILRVSNKLKLFGQKGDTIQCERMIYFQCLLNPISSFLAVFLKGLNQTSGATRLIKERSSSLMRLI